jgi:hypothetical protein
MAEDILRVNYFTYQFLTAEDFLAEQAYHRRMRRELALAHFGTGVVHGLGVEPAGQTSVMVRPGYAVDPTGAALLVTDERPVSLQALGGRSGFVYVAYGQQEEAPTQVGDQTQHTRFRERPKVDVIEQLGPGMVALAEVTPQPNAFPGIVPSDRVGPRLPPRSVGAEHVKKGEIRHSQLSLDGDANPHGTQAADVGALPSDGGTITGALTVNGTAALKGGLSVSGGTGASVLSVSGASTLAGALTVNGAATLKKGLSVSGGTLTPALTVDGSTGALAVTGAATLAGALTVDGAAAVKGGLSVSGGTGGRSLTVLGPALVQSKLSVDGPIEVLSSMDVGGDAVFGFDTNPLRITPSWSQEWCKKGRNRAEISNDTSTQKALLIVGNRSSNDELATVYVRDRLCADKFCNISDGRLKTDVTVVPQSLERLSRVRGVAFRWRDDGELEGVPAGTGMGVVAQEVAQVFPELISTMGVDERLAVDYTGLTAVLIEAVRELKSDSDRLRQRVAALESIGRADDEV